jgi:predicted nucleic acid-binding protein
MITVIDASAAAEIGFNLSNAEKYKDVLIKSTKVLAPDLFIPEITNVYWKYVLASQIDFEKAKLGIEYSIKTVDEFIDTQDIWNESLSEAVQQKHSVYDIMYAITARRNSAILLTLDKKLKSICTKLKIETI